MTRAEIQQIQQAVTEMVERGEDTCVLWASKATVVPLQKVADELGIKVTIREAPEKYGKI